MGFFGKAIKGGLAVKAADVVKRELQKRGTQRKSAGRPVKTRKR